MRKLVEGIHHFQSSIFSTQRELFERLAKGQTPDALFVTCSDSRINPNLITQTEPGELFILRNAGNIIPPYGQTTGGEQATIEFAVMRLGIQDIIVCGHSLCGAVQGLFNKSVRESMPSLNLWLNHAETARRIVEEKYAHLEPAERMSVAVQEHVLAQLENLRTHPAVAVGLSRGRLKLHAWVYKLETGQVFAYDPARGQFAPLQESAPLPVPARLATDTSI